MAWVACPGESLVRYGRPVVVSVRRRPWLFVDVDGVLIPVVVPRTTTRDDDGFGDGGAGGDGNPILRRVRKDLGPVLASLPFELVWATAWGSEANATLAALLGLPPLSVVEWPDAPAEEERDIAAGRHWKTRPLMAWAAGRPFAWIDDEVTDRDRRWVSAHHPARALLHRIDATTGLTDDDIGILTGWTATLHDT